MTGQRVDVRLRQGMEHPRRAEQRSQRVEAEECGEQAADRGALRNLAGHVRGHVLGGGPARSAPDSDADSPTIIAEKKVPMDRAEPELKKVPRMPDAASTTRHR